MLISFAGQKRSGKDTAASALVDSGWKQFAFADKVRQCVEKLDPIIAHKGWFVPRPVRLSEVLAKGHTWESLKESKYRNEVRRLLQRMGTDAGRDVIDSDVWVNAIRMTPGVNYVATDCRFSNEADWTHRNGGLVVHIVRPETDDPNPVHPSEIIDFPCDITIVNDGSRDDFIAKVRQALPV